MPVLEIRAWPKFRTDRKRAEKRRRESYPRGLDWSWHVVFTGQGPCFWHPDHSDLSNVLPSRLGDLSGARDGLEHGLLQIGH